ncbi:MAG: SMP-30/gluconolactonase/LRE family protein [Bryobacterales bacterium]|nr:SMP-30/gluconolactonase/LRE family protein [Bryobacterales bacterium]
MRIAADLALVLVFAAGACLGQTEAVPAAAIAFTEGPAADAAGNVYFTDLTSRRIFLLPVKGRLSTFRENSNGANGLVFDERGRLIACETGDAARGVPPRVTRTDLASGAVEVLAAGYEGKPLGAPNDVTLDGRGRIYFTDQGQAPGVYRIDPDGRISRILAAPAIERPNGVMISPDDRTLYLVESNQAEGGARMIRAYDLSPQGSVSGMRVFHNFYPGRSADGLCIDSQGNLYAAAGLNRRRNTSETLDTRPGVHVFSPAGELLRFIPIPEDTVTNCAFGGPDLRMLYVTAGKTLYRIPSEVPGLRR